MPEDIERLAARSLISPTQMAKLRAIFNPPQQQMSEQDVAAMQPETYANPLAKGIIGGLATLPQRAIEGAAQYQPGSGEVPDAAIGPALETAMLPMGTAAIAGVPLRAGETALGAGPLRRILSESHEPARGRSGRPMFTEPLPQHPILADDIEIGNVKGSGDAHIMHDANGQVRGIYGSKQEAQAARDLKMQQSWQEHGPTYGDEYGGAPPKEFYREVKRWNKEHPDQAVDLTGQDDRAIYTLQHTGKQWHPPYDDKPELQQRLDALDEQWMDRTLPYPGARKASEHFNTGEEGDAANALSIRASRLAKAGKISDRQLDKIVAKQ